MKKLIYLLITALLALNFSCKDSGTGPEEKKSVRGYTWTADTLSYEGSAQTLMRSIWGSSANDIYICGHNDRSKGNLWHYDGHKWTAVDLFQKIESTANTLYAVHGTSPDNVWVVGSKIKNNPNPPPNFLNPSFILQYDGTKWIEHKVNTNSAVYSVYANSANDVWACGGEGIVYHYDGSVWKVDTLKVHTSQKDQYSLFSITKGNSIVYVHAAIFENNSSRKRFYLFERENEIWSKIDSFVIDNQNNQWKWGANHLYYASFGKLYAVGYGIYEMDAGNWITILPQDFASFRGFYDKGKDNMIACGDGGYAYHYDGTDWQEIKDLHGKDLLYTGVWMKQDESFVISNDLSGYPQTTVVLHGK